MKKIADIVIKTLKGHNATGDLIKAMIMATTEASGINFTTENLGEIYEMVLHELNNDFNPLAEVNVF